MLRPQLTPAARNEALAPRPFSTHGFAVALLVLAAAIALGGCATPGPLHVYSMSRASIASVRDVHQANVVEAPSFVRAEESVTAFAYDPFTDHFFLAITPGNVIRVVDRPARAVKREFAAPDLDTATVRDFAIKPRTGHVFAIAANGTRIAQITRLGKPLRDVPLPGTISAAAGIAYDAVRDQLLIVDAAEAAHPRVSVIDLDGRRVRGFALERSVTGPIAFDAEARELYAILHGPAGGTIAVFSEEGRYLRSLDGNADFIDLGPRSLVRVF